MQMVPPGEVIQLFALEIASEKDSDCLAYCRSS